MRLQKLIGSIVRAALACNYQGGASNRKLTVTADPTIRSIRSTTQLSNCGFVSANCHLWLPATCHSIGKFPFRHAATIRRPSQRFSRAAKIEIVNKYLFFRLCSIPAASCVIPLLLEIPLNTNTSSQLLPRVLRTHVVDFSFLRAPLSPFFFFVLLSAHFNDKFLLQFSFSSVSVFDNRLLS